MSNEIWIGILVPFAGTVLGSGFVYFLKGSLSERMQKILTGFAAGVMVAASFWSLLLPAIEYKAEQGAMAVVPAFIGFWIGILFLLLLDEVIPHIHIGTNESEGPRSKLSRSTKMMLAVTLHNIPEGLAVGVVFAGMAKENMLVSFSSALALAIGIAIQNIPEGAILSMPLHSSGMSKNKAFLMGALSGIAEPAATIVTILFSSLVIAQLPYYLSFAAGAMFYVVVEELIPEMSAGKHSNLAVVCFAAGFSLMMVLDVVLG